MITGQIKNQIDQIWEAFWGKQSGITNPVRKKMTISDTYLIKIKMLETFVVGTVEHNHDNNNLGRRHTAVPMVTPFTILAKFGQAPAMKHCIKNSAEFIGHYEYFSNFVFDEHSDMSICL